MLFDRRMASLVPNVSIACCEVVLYGRVMVAGTHSRLFESGDGWNGLIEKGRKVMQC